MRVRKPGNPNAKCSYKNGKAYRRKDKHQKKNYGVIV